ncbi:hypothetical protein F5Y16DRAFT_417419 [Xylariaceae sp. FL0255]|nr:hypothetical protein F5Y16DRAFT_417419 [Xylariaceae sp. FL0255]
MGKSLLACLCEKMPGAGFKVNPDTAYSEMWFGDCPDFRGPKRASGEALADVLQADWNDMLRIAIPERRASIHSGRPESLALS